MFGFGKKNKKRQAGYAKITDREDWDRTLDELFDCVVNAMKFWVHSCEVSC